MVMQSLGVDASGFDAPRGLSPAQAFAYRTACRVLDRARRRPVSAVGAAELILVVAGLGDAVCSLLDLVDDLAQEER